MDIFEILKATSFPAYESIVVRLKRCELRYSVRCGIHQMCRRCAGRRAKRFTERIISLAPGVEREATQKIRSQSWKIKEIRKLMTGVLKSLYPTIPGNSRKGLTRRKKRLYEKVTRLSKEIKTVTVIRPDEILHELKAAKKEIRRPGEIDSQVIKDRIKKALLFLYWQVNPKWKAVWLTMPYSGLGLPEKIEAVKETFKRFWRDYLSGPCSAAFAVVEVSVGDKGEPHVHLNCIFFGHYLSVEHFRNQWVSVGGGRISYPEDFRFPRKEAIRRLSRYFLKYDESLSPTLRVALWEAARGRQLVVRLGRFRKRHRPQALKAGFGGVTSRR